MNEISQNLFMISRLVEKVMGESIEGETSLNNESDSVSLDRYFASKEVEILTSASSYNDLYGEHSNI